jgi:hypothetical protein
MKRRAVNIILLSVFASLAACAALASSAAASPVWKFEGTTLTGTEMLIGGATESSWVMPGLTTKCKGLVYQMEIQNTGGTGEGEITYLPIFKCTTSSGACTVKTINAEGLPWSAQLTTVGANHYLVIPTLKVGIVYAGETCVLGGVFVAVKGSAGGRFETGTESFVFDAASSSATGTELKALGSKTEWNTTLSAKAFGPHLGEALTVS